MNRKLLLITLLSALALFSSFPTALALAESTTDSSSTTPASNQSSDDTHEEELVLIPELLDRLEGDNTDDTDLGPEIKEETVNSNGNKITESEPDLMDIEDDSDAIAEIYKETHPNALNDDVVENQEKNLLNINHGSIHEESYDNIPDNGDAEVEQEDFGGQPQSDESDGAIATESVNIDDQYHDFNVEPCTAVLIPINKQKVEVSVNGVSNAITAMLTDKQFTNCTDLVNFACPEGASFCRKLSLDFQDAEGTDEENEAFQLNNEACGVNNAYLYVLPGDMAISLSYQVRVEANGAPQCANEEDEPTLNEMMGSESEEINDEDSSSDDTDTDTDEEIQEDLNDDPFQMFDNKIIEEHEVINGKPRTFEVKICTVVEIPVHGKAVNIVVDTLVNAKKMMVTDAQMSGCSDLNAFECPQNSTFCKVQDLSEPDGVQLTTEACDLDTAYLYVLPEEFDGISSYQVNTTVLNQNACELKNSEVPVVPVETTEETTKPSETPEATESQSDDSSDSDSENVSANQDTEDIATTDGQTATEDNTDAADPEAIGNVGSKVDGGMIFVIVFVTSLVLFMGVVCYYRYQFRKNRVELFHPPSWCPQCLFPRANEALISVKGNNAFDSDYEPPVL